MKTNIIFNYFYRIIFKKNWKIYFPSLYFPLGENYITFELKS